jgi:hypothetical protein
MEIKRLNRRGIGIGDSNEDRYKPLITNKTDQSGKYTEVKLTRLARE